jgi:hypothetical protein
MVVNAKNGVGIAAVHARHLFTEAAQTGLCKVWTQAKPTCQCCIDLPCSRKGRLARVSVLEALRPNRLERGPSLGYLLHAL